jgi:hypothetical protein
MLLCGLGSAVELTYMARKNFRALLVKLRLKLRLELKTFLHFRRLGVAG